MDDSFVLGVDPGVSAGGIAVLSRSTERVIEGYPLDDIKAHDLFRLVREIRDKFHPTQAFKEKYVASYSTPNAAFAVGYQHGVLDLAFYEAGIPLREIGAREWQRAIHETDKPEVKPKYLSLRAAEKYFAGHDFRPFIRGRKKPTRAQNPHMGILEAALIARFGLTLLNANEI